MIKRTVLSTSTQVAWTFYGAIKRIEPYQELIEDLESANEKDVIILKIAGPGGCVDTGRVIVNAIKECRGIVIAKVVDACYSMTSIIALACHGMVMAPNTYLMFHDYSTGMGGKGDEFMQSAEQGHKLTRKLFNDICIPFFSKGEMNKIFDGKDKYIWDTDETLKARIKRHFKSIEHD